jgi:hypothetical protein
MGLEFLTNAAAGRQIPKEDFRKMLQYSKAYLASREKRI